MSARKFDVFNERKTRYGNVTVAHETRYSRVHDLTSEYKLVRVKLHNTYVVDWKRADMACTLRTGGWNTITTRTAINNALGQIFAGGPIPQVRTIKGQLYLDVPCMPGYPEGRCIEFREHMTVSIADGRPYGTRMFEVA